MSRALVTKPVAVDKSARTLFARHKGNSGASLAAAAAVARSKSASQVNSAQNALGETRLWLPGAGLGAVRNVARAQSQAAAPAIRPRRRADLFYWFCPPPPPSPPLGTQLSGARLFVWRRAPANCRSLLAGIARSLATTTTTTTTKKTHESNDLICDYRLIMQMARWPARRRA